MKNSSTKFFWLLLPFVSCAMETKIKPLSFANCNTLSMLSDIKIQAGKFRLLPLFEKIPLTFLIERSHTKNPPANLCNSYQCSLTPITTGNKNLIDCLNKKIDKDKLSLYVVTTITTESGKFSSLMGCIESFEKVNKKDKNDHEAYEIGVKFFHRYQKKSKIGDNLLTEVHNFFIHRAFRSLVDKKTAEKGLCVELLSLREVENLLSEANEKIEKKPLLNEEQLIELFPKKENVVKNKINQPIGTSQKEESKQEENKEEPESKPRENRIFATTQSITDIKFAEEEWFVRTSGNSSYTYHILKKATDRGIKIHVIENIVENYLAGSNSLTTKETEDLNIIKLIDSLGICVVYNKNEKAAITAYDVNNSL